MNKDTCAEMQLLVQADVDGELGAAEAARVGEHLRNCPECATLPAQLGTLSARLRSELPYHPAPERLRSAVRAQLAAMAAEPRPTRPSFWHSIASSIRAGTAISFGAGFAVAGCLMLALVLPQPTGGLTDEIVSDHIRALQPGHLMDVVSTDQHTVKPWFDGRSDFAPPVKDLKDAGFPLTGGRLDYLAGHQAAVLVYGRRQHVIDLFVWPEHGNPGPLSTSRSGYNVVRWARDGMSFWAVSDVAPNELEEFARVWQAG